MISPFLMLLYLKWCLLSIINYKDGSSILLRPQMFRIFGCRGLELGPCKLFYCFRIMMDVCLFCTTSFGRSWRFDSRICLYLGNDVFKERRYSLDDTPPRGSPWIPLALSHYLVLENIVVFRFSIGELYFVWRFFGNAIFSLFSSSLIFSDGCYWLNTSEAPGLIGATWTPCFNSWVLETSFFPLSFLGFVWSFFLVLDFDVLFL